MDLRADLPRLVLFARVVELGSFTAAAKASRLSRPAVSAAVSGLEESLGVTLLHRTTRRVETTRAGAELLERVGGLLDATATALHDASTHAARGVGTLRIKTPGGIVAERIVAPAVARVVREHGIEVDLEASDHRTAPVEGDVDGVVRMGTAREAGLVMRKLGSTEDVVVAAPSVVGAVTSVEALREVQWVVHTSLPRRVSIRRAKTSVSVTMRAVARVDDSSALLGLLVGGAGFGILPRAVIGPELASGQLVEPFGGCAVRPTHLFLLLPSRRVPVRVKRLIEALKTALNPPSPRGRRGAV